MTYLRIMGLDVGTKRIGVAVSDELLMLAQGRETVARTSDREAVDRIREIAVKEGICQVVVGLPVGLDGNIGKSAEECIKFADKIKEALGLPVKMWDERFSTKEAESVMIEASVRREKRRKVIDKMAAQLILQSYLDSLRAERDRLKAEDR
jgi:putative Holliday junction resolvase